MQYLFHDMLIVYFKNKIRQTLSKNKCVTVIYIDVHYRCTFASLVYNIKIYTLVEDVQIKVNYIKFYQISNPQIASSAEYIFSVLGSHVLL